MKVRQFFGELKQRHVYRVAVIYAAVVWILLQVADVVLESFDGSQWWMRGLIFTSVVGFPIVLLASWFFRPAVEEKSAGESSAPEVSGLPVNPTLIVLPFECYSERMTDRWYADVLTEDLTNLI